MAVMLVRGTSLSRALKVPRIRRGIEMPWQHWLHYRAAVSGRALCNPGTTAAGGWDPARSGAPGPRGGTAANPCSLPAPGCKPQWSISECQGPPTPLFPLARTFLAVFTRMAQKPWEPSHYISLPLMPSVWSEPCFWNLTAKSQNLWLFWKQVMLLHVNTRR